MLYPKDPKVRVERHDKTLKIEWNWGGKGGYVFVALAVILAILIWFAAASTYSSEVGSSIWPQIGFFAFLSLLTVVPMVLMGLTSALNKTTIHADHERLSVRVSPLPWVRPKIVPGKGIQQFFSTTTASSSSAYVGLYVIDKDSHYVRLAGTFPSGFAVHQICHELQDWYGLEDLPVYGQTDLPHQPGPRVR